MLGSGKFSHFRNKNGIFANGKSSWGLKVFAARCVRHATKSAAAFAPPNNGNNNHIDVYKQGKLLRKAMKPYLLPWVAVILKAQYHRVLGCFKCTLAREEKGLVKYLSVHNRGELTFQRLLLIHLSRRFPARTCSRARWRALPCGRSRSRARRIWGGGFVISHKSDADVNYESTHRQPASSVCR